VKLTEAIMDQMMVTQLMEERGRGGEEQRARGE
jgi:hypothetical protein